MRNEKNWFCFALFLLVFARAEALDIYQSPLFLATSAKPNALVILDNSNSMDEAPNGTAVGSNSAESKSEIARGVIRNLVDANGGRINMGLMAYKQNDSLEWYLHNAYYDVSYDPVHYDTAWTGARNSPDHKKYRVDNPSSSDPSDFIHFNVALPFYASSNQDKTFCFTTTAVPFSDTNPDTYSCYPTKTGISNVLAATEGYSGALSTRTFVATDSDIAQGIYDFGNQLSWNYISRAWYVNSSPGRGYLHTPIKLLDSTQATTIKNKLKCNIPELPSPCESSGIKNAGLTPIEGTLLTAKDYFAGSLTNTSEFVSPLPALPTSCGKNYVILVTDGLPSTDNNGNAITDPAAAITAAADAARLLKQAGVETYVVGFALPYGVDPATLDTIAAAGGTGTAFNASDLASLDAALGEIFVDIETKFSSGTAIAANSTRLNTETLIYQARFNNSDWSGQVIAFPLNGNGTLGSAEWNTDDSGKIPASSSRRIYTTSTGAIGGGVAFTAANFTGLSSAQQADLNKSANGTTDGLGSDRVRWLRGEDVSGMRNRIKLLGDIVDSDPVYVGAENYGYVKLDATTAGGGQTYLDFIARKKLRRKMLYIGANDGMLHGFDADTGVEIVAYVPKLLSSKLSQLTDVNYGKSTGPAHTFFVDGTLGVGDAYIDTGDGSGVRWHTILVGTFGAGGKGVFALDVSELPATGDPATGTVYFGASSVLWEYSHAELGHVMGAPQIVRMQDGTWAAVFGNGYNSTSSKAQLFAVNLATGALVSGFPIDTGAGSLASTATENGLGPVAAYDKGTRILGDEIDSGSTFGDRFYAGDLLGNVWSFRYNSSGSGGWEITYASSGTPRPLFQAKDGSNNPQPITAPLEIGESPVSGNGVMIFFGTGRYFVTDDNTTTSRQSLYGIWDRGVQVSGRSDLQQQTITHEFVDSESSRSVRVVSNNSVNYEGGSAQRGWYLDLVPPSGTARGERVVSAPLLRYGRVIFNTLVPSTDPCSGGGTSWLMELSQKTGGPLSYSVFDRNGDQLFNTADYVTVTSGGSSVQVPVSGLKSEVGITKTPAWISAGGTDYKVQSGTDTTKGQGGVQVTTNKGTGNRPRTSWRQLFSEDR